ncbi:hypothetical protein [Flavobacterium xanthum]|uniref:Uncharacterized protein n=1 Tax=Flavobacterium xanthum TaxID=69322 RepID=A0A1M7F8D2_9FLAO|nr:hypothetical protein [Flavobacterium xanthum]SHM00250.1 hypothetical protein SAMN05443669_101965 [Flavobacterium xanthum]
MTKIKFSILLILISLSSIYSQHKIRETFSEKFVPFVEIYSEKGDLIGITDIKGAISSDLEDKIRTSKTTNLTFVNSLYITTALSIEEYNNTQIISLNKVSIELSEVVITKPKTYKYLKLKGYFRSLQINEDKPHYFIDGIAEIYISLKSGKTKLKIISNRSFENKSVKQLSKTFFFMVAGVPTFNEFSNFESLNAEYNLKTVNNSQTNILDQETSLEKGTIATVNNKSNLQLEIISQSKPKIMKALGMETDYNNYTINSIYENNEIQKINSENIIYYKEIRSYDIKRKQKDKFQKVEATHEFYLLEKEYVNELGTKQFDNFYSFKRPNKFNERYWEKVDNQYFQPLPKSIEKYIEENLMLTEK